MSKTHKRNRSENNSTPNEIQKLKQAKDEILNKIVTRSKPPEDRDITEAYKTSSITLGNYVTLDCQHANDIMKLETRLRIYAKDQTLTRPYNVMILAPPGSGKSHFISCLAEVLRGEHVTAVKFNMANMKGPCDLVNPVERVRNLEVDHKLPLLFLDEFDSHEDHFSALLPLLWDGELNIGKHDLKVGKTVIVLAGSRKDIQNSITLARTMNRDIANGPSKIVDLLSRVNGIVLRIPSLDEISGDRDRRADKVCVAISLLKRRFEDEKIKEICWSLLKFISITPFRYGVRSIAHLIDCIPGNVVSQGHLNDAQRLLPPLMEESALEGDSLLYHIISNEGISAVVRTWRGLIKVDKPVIVDSEL